MDQGLTAVGVELGGASVGKRATPARTRPAKAQGQPPASDEATFVVELVEDPTADYKNRFFDVLRRLARHEPGLAQGLLVRPYGAAEYELTEEIATAALHGVLTMTSPLPNLTAGARQIQQKFLKSAPAFDNAADRFTVATKARRHELLHADED